MKFRPALLATALLATACAAGVLVAAPATAIDPPVNDDLADAIDISAAESPVSADNTLATTETGEPSVNEDAAGIGHTVWYSWTAPADGSYEFDTLGSAAGDTVLTAYSTGGQPASFANLLLLEQSDDLDNGAGNKLSGIVLNATSGTTYYLQVATWGYSAAATGQTTLSWSQLGGGADFSVTAYPADQGSDPGSAPALLYVVVTNEGSTTAKTSVTIDASSTPGAGIDPWQAQGVDFGLCPTGPLPAHGQPVCNTPWLGPGEPTTFTVYGGLTDAGVYQVPVTLAADAWSGNNTSTYHHDFHPQMPLQLTDYWATKAPGTQVTLHYRVDRTDGWTQRQSSFAFKLPANARLEDDVEARMSDVQHPDDAPLPVDCVVAGQQLVCPFTGHGTLEVSALVTPTSDAPMVTPYTLAASYVSSLSATDDRVTPAQFCDNLPTPAGQVITGGLGANILCGGAGNDSFTGGRGNDLIFGGTGLDTVSYAGSAAPMFVSLTQQSIDGWGSRPLDWHYGDGQDSFTGIENATGSAYADMLIGNAVVNRLTGGSGNDTLTGGAGKDVLSGGAGTDTCKESTDTKVSCEK